MIPNVATAASFTGTLGTIAMSSVMAVLALPPAAAAAALAALVISLGGLVAIRLLTREPEMPIVDPAAVADEPTYRRAA